MGSQRVRCDWSANTSTLNMILFSILFAFCILSRLCCLFFLLLFLCLFYENKIPAPTFHQTLSVYVLETFAVCQCLSVVNHKIYQRAISSRSSVKDSRSQWTDKIILITSSRAFRLPPKKQSGCLTLRSQWASFKRIACGLNALKELLLPHYKVAE